MKEMNIRGLIILFFDLILAFSLVKYLPFTPEENKGLALLVFIGVLWLTEAFHIVVTSMMVPVIAIGMNVLTTQQAFAPFAQPIIFMFLGGFIIAAILNVQKLDLWIANHILNLSMGNLKYTVYALFTVTAGLSMFINNTAVAAMMLPLTMGLLQGIDAKEHRNVYVYTLLGVAFSASIGGIATLVGSAPNAILASQVQISFSEWLYYGIPVSVILMFSMVFSLQVVLRPNLNQTIQVNMENIPLTLSRAITLVIFVLTAICLIASKWIEPILRSFLELDQRIANIDAVIAMSAVVLMCIANGAKWSQIQERTEWGVLLLFGGGLTLGIVLRETGASDLLATGIVEYIGAQHLLVMALILAAFVNILTEFTSNTATAALLMPIFISVAESMGLPPVALAAIIACGASCAFMLPIATPPNAIVFSTGHIKQIEMIKVGLLLNIASILSIGCLSYFFWMGW